MRGKGWEERGPKTHSKNSDFRTPLIWVLFSGLPIVSTGTWWPQSSDVTAMCDAIRVAYPEIAQCEKQFSRTMQPPPFPLPKGPSVLFLVRSPIP